MHRLYYIIFSIIISCNILFAPASNEIKGIIASNNKMPLENVLVSLIKNKSQVASYRSESDGWWGFNDIAPATYVLKVEGQGYCSSEFEIVYSGGEQWIDTLFLTPSNKIELDMVSIKAKRQSISYDKRIAIPSSRQKSRCSDGATLLGMMMFPQLTIVRGSHEIKYWGEGILKYYINDNEATWNQIVALNPKDVIRIEYIDRPSLELTNGEDVGVVIRYITKVYARGVFNSISLDKPLNRSKQEWALENRIKYFDNEYAFNYKGNYDRSSKGLLMNNSQTYNFNNGQLTRNDEALTTGGLSVYNSFSFAFSHNKANQYLAVNASYDNRNSPSSPETFLTKHSGLRTDTIQRQTNTDRNNQNFSVKLNYRRTLNNRSGYNINVSYGYGYGYSNYLAEDFYGGNKLYTLTRDIRTKSQMIYATAGGYYVINPQITLTSYLVDSYNYGHNDYKGNYSGISKNKSNNISLQNSFVYRNNKFSNSFLLSFLHNSVSNFSDETYRTFYINATSHGRYNINRSNHIDYKLSFMPTMVSRSDLSTAEVVLNEYQTRRGNPGLKNGSFTYFLLDGTTSLSKHLNLFITTDYAYHHNRKNEGSILEEQKVVRLPINFNTHVWRYSAELSLLNVKHFYATATIGQNHYWNRNVINKTNRIYHNTYMRLSGTVELGPWDVSFDWWNHNNDYHGETLASSGRSLDLTVERTWLDGRLTTALSFSNPFKTNYCTEYVRNYSDVAPYSTNLNYTSMHQIVSLSAIYKFSFGKRVSNDKISTDLKANSGNINQSIVDK